jgi:hypothetical protein
MSRLCVTHIIDMFCIVLYCIFIVFFIFLYSCKSVAMSTMSKCRMLSVAKRNCTHDAKRTFGALAVPKHFSSSKTYKYTIIFNNLVYKWGREFHCKLPSLNY